MSTFVSFLEDTANNEGVVSVSTEELSNLKITPRSLGATYLNEGDIFFIRDLSKTLRRDEKLEETLNEGREENKKVKPIYFIFVEIVDNNGNYVATKRLYFGSLAKTVQGYELDPTTKTPKKIVGAKGCITTLGNVATKVQNDGNIIKTLQDLKDRKIFVKKIHEITTYNKNSKEWHTGSTLELHCNELA